MVCSNNWIRKVFNDETDEEEYEHINTTIPVGNVMNMSLIILEVNYCDIDVDHYTCYGYFIFRFSSYLYNLKVDLSIYRQASYFGEIVCGRKYVFNQYQFSI